MGRAAMASAKWAVANSGSWYAPANWSTGLTPGGAPGSDDVATVDLLGRYTVNVGNSGIAYIGSVNLNAPSATLTVSGVGMTVKTSLTVARGTLLLEGTLKGGSLLIEDSGVVQSSFGAAVLNGVRVQGTLDLVKAQPEQVSALILLNGTNFSSKDGVSPGLIRMSRTALTFGDSAQFDNAAISFVASGFTGGGSLNLGNPSDAVGKIVTLGRYATLDVAAGFSAALGGKGTLVNGGTINVAGTLTVGSLVSLAQASQPGGLSVQAGGTLAFGVSGASARLTGLSGAQIAGNLSVKGDMTTASLNTGLEGANITGQLVLNGVLDNSAANSVLDVKAGTPLATVDLDGATVRGGTLRIGSGSLKFSNSDPSNSNDVVDTFDGVRTLGSVALNGVQSRNTILALKNGVAFAGLSGSGRGGIAVSGQAELLALDSETLDHVDLQFSAGDIYTPNPSLLVAASGTNLTLGGDASLNVLGLAAISGGGTFGYAGAVTVQGGGSLAIASGTTFVKAGGSLAVAAGGTFTIGWIGTAAPLSGIAGATVNGTLKLLGSLTSAAYTAALGGVTGTGSVSVGGTLDNTGAALALSGGTVAERLTVAGVLQGGSVTAAISGLTLASGAVLDRVTLRGPTTLRGSNSPLPALFRNGLTLVDAGGLGPGLLTLNSMSLQAADAETLDNAAVRLIDGTLSAASGSRLTLGRGLALDVAGASTLTNVLSQGGITVEDNSKLSVDSSFASTGALNLKSGSTLELLDTTTTARLIGLNAIAAGPGAISLGFGATLDNASATLTLLKASRLNNLAAPYLTLNGGNVVNAGGNIAFTGTTVLDAVTWQGAFAPVTTASFIFRHGTVVQGLNGARALIDLGSGGSKLSLSGPSENTDLRMSNGALSTLLPGPVLLGAGTHATLGGSFATFASGEHFEPPGLSNAGTISQTGTADYAALTNTGTIAISNGFANASTLTNTGLISLDAATLTIGTPAVIGGTIAFQDPTAKLVFQGTGAVGATLRNFQNGDSVDIQGLSYSATVSISVQGDAVQVNQGSVRVGIFRLLGGSYSTGQFSLAADGKGGTLLRTTHPLNAPILDGPGKDFDAAYYLANNPDVAAAGVDPLQHYLNSGWREGRNPSAYFNTGWYLNQNPDVRAAGMNPLQHYEDVGWKQGRDPGPNFSVGAYLAANPDVKAAGIDPLQHFLINGRAEGRIASPATPHAVGAQDVLVDRTWYLAQHPDVAATGEDAAANYNRVGWTLGYNPNQWFDTTYYLKTNFDVAAAHIDPLAHFEAYGCREGREPSLAFNDRDYLANNPDVAAAEVNPLAPILFI